MATGDISPSLPFVKQQALAVLKKNYPDGGAAEQRISDALRQFYSTKYPQIYAQDRSTIDHSVAAVQAVYSRNVFPEMKVTWGTYVNNLGHMDSPGCFRCHDGSHTSASGKAIPNDCDTCHEIKAMEEKNPAILADLGIVPAQAAAGNRERLK